MSNMLSADTLLRIFRCIHPESDKEKVARLMRSKLNKVTSENFVRIGRQLAQCVLWLDDHEVFIEYFFRSYNHLTELSPAFCSILNILEARSQIFVVSVVSG